MKWLYTLIIAVLLTGCGLTSKNKGVTGASGKAEDKAKAKVETVAAKISYNKDTALNVIGEYAYGVQYALHSTNYVMASELNTRVVSLSPTPTIDEMIAMRTIVNSNSFVLLQKKDKEIQALQEDKAELLQDKEAAVSKYITLADKTAAQADQFKATLNQMDSWLGLGAVWYGLKHFFFSSMWILLGIGIVYLVLRVLSVSNPIAASIFGIFNIVGSWVINIIKMLAPKAVDAAKLVSQESYTLTKDTLAKLVDAVESVNATNVKTEVAASMDSSHKDIITALKKSLNWK
jgi:xanthosine utilization system XapX-like protein